MNNYRIGIIGTTCVGKSTLAKELSNVLETSNDLFSRLIDDKININLNFFIF